jgi:nitrogen regulatory protein PII-like uncharacterized protein
MEEKILEQIKGLIAEAQKDSVSKKELETRVAEINETLKTLNNKEDNHAEVKALKEAVEKLTGEMVGLAGTVKALNEQPGKKAAEKPMTFREAVKAAIVEKSKDVSGLLIEKNDDGGKHLSLKDYFTEKGNRTTPSFTMKDAVDMLLTNIAQNNVPLVRNTELDAQRVGIPLAAYPHVLDWMPSKNISKGAMSLLVAYDYQDGSGTKAEGEASGKSSLLFKTVEFKAFYIETHFKLSDETLDDLEEALDEIAIIAPDMILSKVDSKILSALGDDASDIAGMLTANKKTDFASGTTYKEFVENANLVDVIATMKLQGKNNKYVPDIVGISPTDITRIAAEKDQMDNSKVDRRVSFNAIGEPVAICGMRIQECSDLAAGATFVASSKLPWIGKRKDMTFEIGYDGTDFTEGQKTAKFKMRLAFGVRDKAGVIYCADIYAARTAINKA